MASHFVPSNRLDALEKSLIKLDHPDLESIKRTIDQFSINREDMSPSKILQGKNRDTIERYILLYLLNTYIYIYIVT